MAPSKLAIVAGLLVTAGILAAVQETGHLEYTSPLGRKFYSLPDTNGFVAKAQKELQGDMKHPGLWLQLAQAQAAVWQDREAIATLAHALELAPKNPALYTERGHRELPLHEFKRAQEDLKKSLELDPNDVQAYYHFGLSNYFVGEFEQAAEAFRKAVEFAPNDDERINSTNWLYASLRRAHQPDAAAKALEAIPPEMKNTEPHTAFYLNLVRFFQGRMTEAEALPPEPPKDNKDTETELRFDTVAYGIGNWHLYNDHPNEARKYFERVYKGHVWITWGFIGSEIELARMKNKPALQ